MNPLRQEALRVARRTFLGKTGLGLGAMALAGLGNASQGVTATKPDLLAPFRAQGQAGHPFVHDWSTQPA